MTRRLFIFAIAILSLNIVNAQLFKTSKGQKAVKLLFR